MMLISQVSIRPSCGVAFISFGWNPSSQVPGREHENRENGKGCDQRWPNETTDPHGAEAIAPEHEVSGANNLFLIVIFLLSVILLVLSLEVVVHTIQKKEKKKTHFFLWIDHMMDDNDFWLS